jgi:hypothetical protein
MVVSGKKILEQALNLQPDERFMLIEGFLMSLDQPESTLERYGLKEQRSD